MGQVLENQLERAATVGTSFDPLELDLVNLPDDNQHEQRSASLISSDLEKTGKTSTSTLKRKYERLPGDGAEGPEEVSRLKKVLKGGSVF